MSPLHRGVCFLLSYMLLSSSSSRAAVEPEGSSGGASSNSSDYFLYFAYGSNLLRERLVLRNPSATFFTVGYLQNYTLQFGYWSNSLQAIGWHGGVASIQQRGAEEVWGVVWRMRRDNLQTLDDQEGVQEGAYMPLEVNVTTAEGDTLCRTYKMNHFHPYLPSPPYKQVVCLGARQNGLPLDYIHKLEAVETNGYKGPSILDDIEGIGENRRE
uniref:Gamma-glutamylcyclotransferase n=1 Tax=Muraenolepis orangiensis TaxID=630683 RepID=A0A9Q0DZQ9_9TELE|nr:hypothetical protein NHX12_001378 [Muraenolepis orangiensis]